MVTSFFTFSFQYATLLALLSFAFISSITPGPNNLMLLHSGLRFGFTRTVPHMTGVAIGFATVLILCCLGIASIMLKIPYAQTLLKSIGFLYMLWLSFLIWKHGAAPDESTLQQHNDHAKPFTFMQAAVFQYVNPKAWIMALTVPAAYLPTQGHLITNTLVITFIFTMVTLLSTAVWAQGGVMIGNLAQRPGLRKIINLSIVTLTLYSAIAIWLEH